MKHCFLPTPAVLLAIALAFAPALIRAEAETKPATAKDAKAAPAAEKTKPAAEKDVKAAPAAEATKPAAAKDVKAAPAAKETKPAAEKDAKAAPAAKAPVTLKTEPAPAEKPTDPKTVLAKVDGTGITLGDVNKEFDQLKTMLKSQGMKTEQMANMAQALQPQILDELVTRQLVNGECKRQKIEVSEADIKSLMDMFTSTLPKGMSVDDFYKKSGLTADVLHKEFKEQAKLQKLLKIGDPDEEGMKTFYDENKDRFFHTPESVQASHILIKVEEGDSDEVKAKKQAKAKEIREKLVAGADFAALAKESSDCPSSERGGDLGSFKRGSMVKPFEDAAFTQKVGEIGPVVKTDFGYHVIVVKDKIAESSTPYAEAKTRIPQMMKAKEVMEKMPEYVSGLREKAKIEYLNGAEPPKPMTPFAGPGGEQ